MKRLAGWGACGKESKFTATAGATTLPLAAAFLTQSRCNVICYRCTTTHLCRKATVEQSSLE